MARSCTLTEPRLPSALSRVCSVVSTIGAESSTTRAQIRTIIRVYVSVAPVCNAFGIVSRGGKGMRPKLILIAGTLLLGVSIAVPLHAQRGSQSPSTPVALTPQDYLDIQQLVADTPGPSTTARIMGMATLIFSCRTAGSRLPGTDRSSQSTRGATSWRRQHLAAPRIAPACPGTASPTSCRIS